MRLKTEPKTVGYSSDKNTAKLQHNVAYLEKLIDLITIKLKQQGR